MRIRRNVYTLSARPRRQVPSMLRQESRVKLRRDSAVSSSLGKVRTMTQFLRNYKVFYICIIGTIEGFIWMNGLSLR